MGSIDYVHANNLHTVSGARAAAAALFELLSTPASLLDVGCGVGTWMRAAMDAGIQDVRGVEGATIPADQLLVDGSLITAADLTRPFDLGRRFDLALCLEVAEHLPESSAPVLIESLTRHADVIAFSAACPGQSGQQHINCQWPEYWQAVFNRRGYACSDAMRWRLWNDAEVEPWYRQNMFVARKDAQAGSEPRLAPVIHPAMLALMLEGAKASTRRMVDAGELGVVVSARSLFAALRRKVTAQ